MHFTLKGRPRSFAGFFLITQIPKQIPLSPADYIIPADEEGALLFLCLKKKEWKKAPKQARHEYVCSTSLAEQRQGARQVSVDVLGSVQRIGNQVP